MSSAPCKRVHPLPAGRSLGAKGRAVLLELPASPASPQGKKHGFKLLCFLVLLTFGLFRRQTFALWSVMPQWCGEAPLQPSLGDFSVSSTELARAVAWSSRPAAGAASPAPGEEAGVKGGVKPRVGVVALCQRQPSGKCCCSGAG